MAGLIAQPCYSPNMKNETRLFIRDAHWALQQTSLILLSLAGACIAAYNVSLLSDVLNPSKSGTVSPDYVGDLIGSSFWACMIGAGCLVWYAYRKHAYKNARKEEEEE